MRLFALLALAVLPVLAQPPVHRENIEWLDVWLPDTNAHALPRVLLIGDSITRAYGKLVETRLAGKAYVGRLATSKSLGDPALPEEITLVLRQQSFDVIHFNNGMHGDAYSEADYAAALPAVLAAIRQAAPNARLILATTTDVRVKNNLAAADPKTERMTRRNEIVRETAARERLPLDDLFAVIQGHPDYHAADGIHFNETGSAALAAQVAASIEKLLPAK
jgi:lysophospholipase L1-like esterase